jgi:hypothetical protein
MWQVLQAEESVILTYEECALNQHWMLETSKLAIPCIQLSIISNSQSIISVWDVSVIAVSNTIVEQCAVGSEVADGEEEE